VKVRVHEGPAEKGKKVGASIGSVIDKILGLVVIPEVKVVGFSCFEARITIGNLSINRTGALES
jgi:hypothetical protein